jgi:hypothetical protein
MLKGQTFTDLAFTHDGRRVIAIAESMIVTWDAATGAELDLLGRLEGDVADRLAVSPDGRWLAITQGMRRVRVLDLSEPRAR